MAVIDDLVAYYALDEASGNATDAHGSTTLTDTNTVGAGTGVVSGSRVFVRANAERLTGTPPITALPVTIAMWVKATSFTGNMNTAFIKQAGNNYAFGTALSSAGKALLYASSAAGSFDTLTGASTLSTGTWYHVVAVARSATDRELYINAASDGTATASRTILSPTQFSLGSYGTSASDTLNGELDEVGFWSRALTTTEISWLYNSGAGRSYADIVAEATSAKSLAWWNIFGQVGS
jgi:hypothetical protein